MSIRLIAALLLLPALAGGRPPAGDAQWRDDLRRVPVMDWILASR